MHVWKYLTPLALMLPGSLVFAQPNVITLDQATRIALERNINVVQAQNNADQAQSSVLSAYGSYLPSLSADGGWGRRQVKGPLVIQGQTIPGVSSPTTTTSTIRTTTWSAGLSANYTLFNGFAREGRFGAASSNADAAVDNSLRTKQSIVYQTEADYFTVLRNGQLVGVSQENLKRDSLQLERIVESNRVGSLSVADVYRQQSAVAADEFDLITAQNNYEQSKADLAALIGLDVTQEYDFADSSIAAVVDTAEMRATMQKYSDLTGLMRRALDARPDYRSARQSLDASESQVTAAKGNYYPAIAASAGYAYNSEELSSLTKYPTINWGIGFSWTLFDGFQTNQTVQLAIEQKRNAEINLAQTERTVNVDVKKAVLNLDAARKQCESAQKGLVSATEDRKIAEERYNLGAGTLLDLLTANASLVQAEANKVNAAYGYLTAKRNLEYVLGERTY